MGGGGGYEMREFYHYKEKTKKNEEGGIFSHVDDGAREGCTKRCEVVLTRCT